ncbi:hypothetical protein JTB14_001490 [Gonioctena quinquepunctata]|nr:hypothetical protein JTB14_001490 [Gonioctena quinquepunctata]
MQGKHAQYVVTSERTMKFGSDAHVVVFGPTKTAQDTSVATQNEIECEQQSNSSVPPTTLNVTSLDVDETENIIIYFEVGAHHTIIVIIIKGICAGCRTFRSCRNSERVERAASKDIRPANNPKEKKLQESSDEVQGDMVDMVEEGESQHTEIYEDHSSSENVFDSDREERRYPLRERKPKYFSNLLYHTISGIEDDPVTVEDAMSRYDRKMWKNAMKDEYDSLIENKVWKLVDLPGDYRLFTVPRWRAVTSYIPQSKAEGYSRKFAMFRNLLEFSKPLPVPALSCGNKWFTVNK